MRDRLASLCLLLLIVGCWSGSVSGHDARPVFVQITQTEGLRFSVTWKVPASVPGHALPVPTLPTDCIEAQPPRWRSSGAEHVGQALYQCEESLAGRSVGIAFPIINPSLSTLYRVHFQSGEERVRVLKPDESEWTIPEAENRLAVAWEYTLLGVEHIWIGIDHLLFVACLLFISGTVRRLLITITGFTVAHSITLALSALDLVRIPTPPVEAAIALSVVFMAWEIARNKRDSLTFRYPVAVSSSFGLLHGFGFAAVLRDIGLPQTELPTALLFFNLGVEIGQILFIVLLWILFLLLRPLLRHALPQQGAGAPRWTALTLPASYAIGVLASFWLFDRMSGFWV